MTLLLTPEALQVKDTIKAILDLSAERTFPKYAIHWDIGNSWR